MQEPPAESPQEGLISRELAVLAGVLLWREGGVGAALQAEVVEMVAIADCSLVPLKLDSER